MHIVDRRLNPKGKSLENRQRFLRRAKALIRDAVKKSSRERDVKDVLEGSEVSIPLEEMREPRLRHGGGGTRDLVLPGNKKFIEGDVLPRPDGGGGGQPSEAGEGESEDEFRFALTGDEFVDLFLDDLELPDLAKRKLAETETEGLCRAGYTTSGSPANISVSRTVRLAAARRIGLRRPRAETIANLEAELAECTDGEPRGRTLRRTRSVESKGAPHPLHRSDRHSLPTLRGRAKASRAGRHVLPHGCVRLHVGAHEGPGEALLYAALRLSDPTLPPRRNCIRSSYRPGRRSR